MSLEEKYDVFLSFRGQDTRDGFTSHLYDGLSRKQITTYIDDEDLEKGDVIKPELLRAIERSVIAIVILSKNYAQSAWCLDELQHIIKCRCNCTIPVFYGGVKPFQVRRQKDSFAEGWDKHQDRYGKDKVDAWKSCLSNIANFSGYDSEEIRPERKLVEGIVQDVLKRLKRDTPNNPSMQGLFGIEDQVKFIIKGFINNDTDSMEKPCQIFGIWGMPGIGKSTLAKVVYSHVHSEFEGSCFLENCSGKFEKHGSTKSLLSNLVAELLEDQNLRIETPFLDSHVKARLKRKTVVIVFDDVSDPKQLEFLDGDRKNMFRHGSRIIITTRDKKVLDNINVDKFVNLQGLEARSRDAYQLFTSHAFKRLDQVPEYEKLIEMALDYAKGVPLVIKVLGSLLHKRSKREWEGTLDKLKKESYSEIQKVLSISYEGLEDNEKKIFLDIACFFKGRPRNIVENVLDKCDFFASSGISGLIDKSLIACDYDSDSDSVEKKVEMHNLNQDMGRDIARKQFKGTRLWCEDEIFDVFQNDKGTEEIQSIFLEKKSSKIESIELSPKVFSKMSNLRLLRIACKVKLPNGLEYLPNSLRYLNWNCYPLTSLPNGFLPKKLVKLNISNSPIERLWDDNVQPSETSEEQGKKDLSLRFRYLEHLFGLDLEDCIHLKDLPLSKHEWKCLEEVNVSGCKSLTKITVPSTVTWLNLSGTSIDEALDTLFLSLPCLKQMYLSNCKRLVRLQNSFYKSKYLEEFYVDGCPELKTFPEILEPMECLRVLDISRTGIIEVSKSIKNLVGLRRLAMNGCIGIVEIPSLPNGITRLELSNCERLVTIKKLPSALRSLYLQNCKKLDSLPDLPTSIRILLVDGCISLNQVPADSISSASNQEDKVGFFSQSNHSSEHFSFANCRSLSPNEIKHILSFARLRILRKALKVVQHYEGCLPPSKKPLLTTGQAVDSSTNTLIVCFPGSELLGELSIPIEFQTVNQKGCSSVTFDLDPNWYRKEFMGFVLCVVASLSTTDATEHSYDTLNFHIKFDYCLITDTGKKIQGVPDFLSMSDLHLSSVEHSFLGFEFDSSYDAVKFSRQGCVIKQVSFNFSLVSASTSEPLNNCQIKKCGIGLIYGPEFLMDMVEVKDTTTKATSTSTDDSVVTTYVSSMEDVRSKDTNDQSITEISDPTLSPGTVGNAQTSSSNKDNQQQIVIAPDQHHVFPGLERVGKWFISSKISPSLKILVDKDPDFLVAVDKLVDFQATTCLGLVGDILMLLSSKSLHDLTDEDRAFLKATIPLLQIRKVHTPYLQDLTRKCIEDDTDTTSITDVRGMFRKQKKVVKTQLAQISSACYHRLNKPIFPAPPPS